MRRVLAFLCRLRDKLAFIFISEGKSMFVLIWVLCRMFFDREEIFFIIESKRIP